jgi:glutathione S-transferase
LIKLYGVPRSRAFRSLWMLEELGLPYENVPVNFATGDTRKPEFLKINPNGHIPALVDDDVTLFESMAINLYLARKHDKGLWPRSVADEGRTWQWSFWAMTELEEPLLTHLLHRVIFPEAQRQPAKAEDAAGRAEKPLGVLDAALAGRRHLLGDAFTVADLNVASVLSWARLSRLDLTRWKNVDDWLTRCLARPAATKAQALR